MNVWKISAPNSISMEESNVEMVSGTAKIKITRLGLTSTDLSIYSGQTDIALPIVPGRIATGLVSEMPEGSKLKKSERVLLSPYELTLKGDYKIKGVDVDGYLGDYAVVPESCVYPLPDGVTDEQAVFTEYIAIANSTITKLDLKTQQYVAILGANALGIIMAQLAIYYQAIPILIDKSEKKLEQAASYGIYYCIDSSKTDTIAKIKQITGGKMADHTVFECRSAQQPQLAFALTARGGRVGIVGYNNFVGKLNADIGAIMSNQLSVIGISSGAKEMGSAINLLANEVVNVDNIIDKSIDFYATPDAFRYAIDNENNYLKVIIKC